MLNPIAPHITEELWSMLGHETLLVFETYPEYDESKLVKDEIDLIISVNGKLRDKMVVENNLAEEKLKKIALGREKIQAFIDGKEIVKIIVVPNKLVNIVIK
jgi:leucyl-tRNA synthetase